MTGAEKRRKRATVKIQETGSCRELPQQGHDGDMKRENTACRDCQLRPAGKVQGRIISPASTGNKTMIVVEVGARSGTKVDRVG